MRVTNDSATPGDIITAAALNEKFTDITAATTGALDEENFGSESVDYPHFDLDGNSGKSDIILRGWAQGDNGVGRTGGTVYTSTEDGTVPVEVSHGSGSRAVFTGGQALAPGDIIRVHWSLFVEDYPQYTSGLFGATPKPVPAWLCWLQWDVTSATLANWTEVPNQTTFAESFGAGAEGGNTEDAQATLVIPHGHITNTNPATAYTYRQRPGAAHHRAWTYARPANYSTLTVYGVRMVISGLFHPSWQTRTNSKNSFEKNIASPGWSGEQITIANARLGALIMRRD